MDTVVVLNADSTPLHTVPLRHAVRMLLRGVARVHRSRPGRTATEPPVPTVIRLTRYAPAQWRHDSGPGWYVAGVLLRDRHRCGYCGGPATVVDRIYPRSRGGTDTWENTVAACADCKRRKGDLTPKAAGLRLRTRPAAPSWATLAALAGPSGGDGLLDP